MSLPTSRDRLGGLSLAWRAVCRWWRLLLVVVAVGLAGVGASAAAAWTAVTPGNSAGFTAVNLNSYLPSSMSVTSSNGVTCSVSWVPGTALDAGMTYVVDNGLSTIASGLTGSTTTVSTGGASFTPRVRVAVGASWVSSNAVSASGPCLGPPGTPTSAVASPLSVSVFAGSGVAGSTNATGTAASFNTPYGMAFDSAGNLYVVDTNNNKVRKVTSVGVVTTFAGSGAVGSADATGTAASFSAPRQVAIDSSDNVYVSDYGNNKIRRITPGGVVTTFAGSGTAGSTDATGTAASFNGPHGIAFDASGNLYVSDSSSNKIRRITSAGVVTTFAGSGTAGSTDATGAAASFNTPVGLAFDGAGNLYVADAGNNKIRKITPAAVVTTFAGSGTAGSTDGTGTAAQFNGPRGLAIDKAGNLFVADYSSNKIRRVTPAGVVTTVAGSGTAGSATGASTGNVFNVPQGVVVDAAGVIHVSDNGNRVTRLSPAGSGSLALAWTAPASAGGSAITDYVVEYRTSPSGTWTTFVDGVSTATSTTITGLANGTAYDVRISAINVVGTGTASSPATATPGVAPGAPTAVALTPGNAQLAASWTAPASTGGAAITDYAIEYRTSPSGTWTVFNGGTSTATTVTITGLTNGTAYDVRVSAVNTNGAGAASSTTTGTPSSITAPGAPTSALASPLSVSVLAGSGAAGYADATGTAAAFNSPYGLAVDASGNIFVADQINNRIRRITPAGVVSTFAGSGTAGSANGTGTAATFNGPRGLAFDSSGNLYVADFGNSLLRRITPGGVVSTFATVNRATGLAFAANGDLYVAVDGDDMIRKVTPGAVVSVFVGAGSSGFADGTGTAARFNAARGLAFDSAGILYVADTLNNRIRRVTPAGVVTTLAGSGTGSSVDATGTAATFNAPTAIASDIAGNLYVAENGGNRIRRVTPGGVVSTIAGNAAGASTGPASGSVLNAPTGIARDSAGALLVTEQTGQRVSRVSAVGFGSLALAWTAPASNGGSAITDYVVEYRASPSGTWTTFVDGVTPTPTATITGLTDGTAYDVRISAVNAAGTGTASTSVTATPGGAPGSPTAVGLTPGNTQLVASWTAPASTGGAAITDYAIEYRTSPSGTWTVFNDGTSTATTATITGLTNGTAYDVRVSAVNTNGASAASSTTTGTPSAATAPGAPTSAGASRLNVATLAGSGTAGSTDATGTAASFNGPQGVVVNSSGDTYVADSFSAKIRKITAAGVVSTFAGSGSGTSVDGTGTGASFNVPTGLAIDGADNLYVAEFSGNKIRKITSAGVVTTLAGSGTASSVDGTGTGASFSSPLALTIDAAGNLYVAEYGGTKIRRITSAGVVTTIATGLSGPAGIGLDPTGNLVVAEYAGNRIRNVTLAGVVSTLAGSGSAGWADGTGTAAAFNSPHGLTVDKAGNVFVTDRTTNRIRRITPAGVVTTIAGTGTAGNADGPSTIATVNGPGSVALDASNNLVIGDWSGNKIRKITAAGSGNLAVAWTAPASNGGSAITDYLVEYRTSPSGTWTTFSDGVSTTLSATVTGLTDGTAYDVRVSAINVAGTGTASTSVTATPGGVPGAPTALALTPSDGQLAASWTAPASTGGAAITDYAVEYRTSSSGTWTLFNDGTSTATTATITGLTNGAAYDVRVSAVNTNGVGAASSSAVGARPFPSAVLGSSMTALWLDAADATKVTTVSGAVLAWADRGPNGQTVTQASASLRPTYVSNVINGLPVVRLDSANSTALTRSSAGLPSGSNPWSWFAVSQGGGNYKELFGWGTNSCTGSRFGFWYGSTGSIGLEACNTGMNATSATWTSTPALVSGVYTGGSVTNFSQWLNGNSNALTSFSPATPNVPSVGQELRIGGIPTVASGYTPASDIGEIIVLNAAATTAQRRAVDEYLATKWGLTLVPAAPTNPTASGAADSATVSWTAPNTGGSAITGYTATATASGQSSQSCTTTGATTCTISGLINGITYSVSVTATNAIGTSTASAAVTATPYPAAIMSTGDLRGWFDADAASTITASASRVSAWNDRSGNGLNVTQATGAAQPTTVAAQLNGRSVMRFAGAQTMSNIAYPTTGWTGVDTFAVAKWTTTGTGHLDIQVLVDNNHGGTGGFVLQDRPDLTNRPLSFAHCPCASSPTDTATTGDGTWKLASASADLVNDTLYRNGAFVGSAANTSAFNIQNRLNVGSWLGTSRYLNGDVAEVLVFRRALTDAERRQVDEYLARKWGLTIAPGLPTALSATTGNTQLSLSWTAPTWNGNSAVTDYVVQYRTSPSGAWTTFSDGVSTATSATITGLTNGTAYDVRVAATNAAGTGLSSATATRTPSTVPGAPTAVSLTAGTGQLTASWTAPASTGGAAITDYVVEYRTSPSGTWTTFADAVSTATTATITGLTTATSYDVRISAVNSNGTGAASSTATRAPNGLSPTGSHPTATTSEKVQPSRVRRSMRVSRRTKPHNTASGRS